MNRIPIFQSIRTLLKRGLRQTEVTQIDRAINCAGGDDHACIPSNDLNNEQRIGPKGIALIKQFEGCSKKRKDGMIEAYPDPGTGAAPWTIGWGATGSGIGPKSVWSQQQCDDRLEADLVRYAADVSREIGNTPTGQSQFDALVSFHYNTGAIGKATLTRKHKSGDFSGAAREFERWSRAGGRVMKGLVRRRAAETDLYISGR